MAARVRSRSPPSSDRPDRRVDAVAAHSPRMPPSKDMLAQMSTHLGRLQYRVERFEKAGSKECGDENRRAGEGGVTFLAVNAIGRDYRPESIISRPPEALTKGRGLDSSTCWGGWHGGRRRGRWRGMRS